MTGRGETPWRRAWSRYGPRSLRGRLTSATLVVAAVLVFAGGLLFRFELHRGLQVSVDNGLADRASVLAAAVRAGSVPDTAAGGSAQPPFTAPVSIAAVYDPAGALVQSEPAGLRLPAAVGADRSTVRYGLIHLLGAELRVRTEPVATPTGTWLVVVGADDDSLHRSDHQIDVTVVAAGMLVLAVTVAGAWVLGGSALRPVERMRRDVAAVGNSGGQVREPGDAAELAALARTMNDLLDRLHRSLAQQHDLVADAGHELRTPLAVLTVELELAQRPGRSAAELRDAIDHAQAEVARLTRLSEDLLLLAQSDAGRSRSRREPVVLRELLEEVARSHRAAAARRDVTLSVLAPPQLAATVDPVAMRRAMDNLVANAVRHSPPHADVELDADRDAAGVRVRVSDHGPGFDVHFLPHAFERFRRADAARGHAADDPGGSGLGLAVVATVAADHGGAAHAGNRPEGGAVVELVLPATSVLPDRHIART